MDEEPEKQKERNGEKIKQTDHPIKAIPMYKKGGCRYTYEQAILFSSGCQEILVQVRLTSLGSRSSAKPLADGGSVE